MSLVAYGSSDDSDGEETSTSGSSGGLFSLLPAPKKPGGSFGPSREGRANSSPAGNITSSDDLDPQPQRGGLFSSLPKPKKRTEPVRITVPQIQRQDVSPELLIAYSYDCCVYSLVISHNLFMSMSAVGL